MASTTETTDATSEAARLAAVRRYAILDTPPDGAFDRVTRLAARFFGVPISIVSIVDNDRIWFKSHYGLDVDEIGREPGLCASAILQHEPWIVSDAEIDPRTLTNPLVCGALGLRFYAAVPLLTSDGYNLGTLNVIDTKPREVTAEEIATLEDLAAIVISELEVRLSARGEQQRLDRERAEFIVTAAHELRTPLAAVYGAAKLVARPDLGDDGSREKLLAVIAEESERLASVVGEILTGAQLEAGTIQIVGERLDSRSLVESAIAAARIHLPANLALELRAAPELPELVSDAGKVRQILGGLIDNAVKYSPAGGQIIVGAEPGQEGGVRLTVSDQGVGVPPAERERIFEKFARLHADGARGVGGTGLGLYIARGLARELGGWVSCAPGSDGGTTFVFELPASLPAI